MQVKLVYPKIPENSNKFHSKCIAFEKYDGSNLHWCFNIDDGWHHFGTRRTQFTFDRKGISGFRFNHMSLRSAPDLFNEKLRDKLTRILCRYKELHSEFIIFTEFHGPNSFAGEHSDEDVHNDTQELTIIDAMFDKKMLEPAAFLTHINDAKATLPIAKIVFQGKYSGQFTEDVRKGKYDVNEGVVCKGVVDGEVFMTKIKTNDYLKRLKQR